VGAKTVKGPLLQGFDQAGGLTASPGIEGTGRYGGIDDVFFMAGGEYRGRRPASRPPGLQRTF